MNSIENESIKEQVLLEQYKNGQANKIVSLIDQSNKKLVKIVNQTKGIYTKKRYKEIERQLSEIAKSLKAKVQEDTDIDGIIDYELRKQRSIMSKSFDMDIADFVMPTVEQIKTSALFEPIAPNMTFQSYLNGIESGLYNIWDANLRTGFLTGMTTNRIVRNIVGTVASNAKLKENGAIEVFKRSVWNNTRTMLQAFAAETRNAVFEKNEQFFGDENGYKYEYLSTLDSRTCKVCGAFDGKRYKSLKDAPKVPNHINCRCIVIPVSDVEGSTRASVNGPVDSKITYEKWLKEQSEDFQKQVLGKTRFKLFKQGQSLSSFVDNGKILTLNELYNKLDYKDVIEIGFTTGRSVGAMARRFYVKDRFNVFFPKLSSLYIQEGTEVTGVKVIAEGKKIKMVNLLIKKYPLQNGKLTSAEDWYKVRGTANLINDKSKKTGIAEIHWYQCKDVGKKEFKVKRWIKELK